MAQNNINSDSNMTA